VSEQGVVEKSVGQGPYSKKTTSRGKQGKGSTGQIKKKKEGRRAIEECYERGKKKLGGKMIMRGKWEEK